MARSLLGIPTSLIKSCRHCPYLQYSHEMQAGRGHVWFCKLLVDSDDFHNIVAYNNSKHAFSIPARCPLEEFNGAAAFAAMM